MLDGAGHVGCEVGKSRFDIGKIKAAGDVLRGIIEDHGHIDRQRAEHLVQVIGTILKVDGVSIERDRVRGVPGQGGDEFGVRRENGASGLSWHSGGHRLRSSGLPEVSSGSVSPRFSTPQSKRGRFIGAHDDPDIGAAEEAASIEIFVRK